MILKRFFDEKLAQTSYLIGCAVTGEAVVVDPNRDVQQYLQAAAEEGVRITHVTETHIHADFVSGTRELAAATSTASVNAISRESSVSASMSAISAASRLCSASTVA